jgi:hypothetical protein
METSSSGLLLLLLTNGGQGWQRQRTATAIPFRLAHCPPPGQGLQFNASATAQALLRLAGCEPRGGRGRLVGRRSRAPSRRRQDPLSGPLSPLSFPSRAQTIRSNQTNKENAPCPQRKQAIARDTRGRSRKVKRARGGEEGNLSRGRPRALTAAANGDGGRGARAHAVLVSCAAGRTGGAGSPHPSVRGGRRTASTAACAAGGRQSSGDTWSAGMTMIVLGVPR